MRLESMYQEIILDHYRHPEGKGLREPFDAEVHHINPTCGDEITLRVRLSEGPDPVIEDVSYDGQGCSISQASTSVLYEAAAQHPLREWQEQYEAFKEMMHSRGAAQPDEDLLGDAVAFVGVSKYPARVKCALLGWMALADAVSHALAHPPDVGGQHAPSRPGGAGSGSSDEHGEREAAAGGQ